MTQVLWLLSNVGAASSQVGNGFEPGLEKGGESHVTLL